MKKKELEALRIIKATPLMKRAAADDPVVKTQHGSGSYKWTKKSCKYKFFIRAIVENNILKVGIFRHDLLDLGGKLPAFELYISRDERRWLTYDRLKGKWRTAKINLLDWSWSPYSTKSVWIKPADAKIIQTYLGTEKTGYDGLLEYQCKIEAENLKLRHKKETDPWDKAMAQVPNVPKDWEQWVAKTGIGDHYIYYEYAKKGATHGYCTHCGKEVPIKHPRHNAKGVCSCCHQQIVFKAVGRAGRVITRDFYTYLLQRCKNGDGFVIREFKAYAIYPKGCHAVPDCCIREMRRTIYDSMAQNPLSFYWGWYKQIESRWISCSPCGTSYYGDMGRVYPHTLANLEKKELRSTGLVEWIHDKKQTDPEKYLAIYQKIPQLEQIKKAELPQLTKECFSDCYEVGRRIKDRQSTCLIKALGIDTQRLKRLRSNNGGWRYLEWLQYEKSQRKLFPDDVVGWLCQEEIAPKHIEFVQDKMSLVQVCNYLQRQMKESDDTSQQVLRTWKDYLSMAEDLGINTNDEIVYRARNLHQRHNELVLRLNQKDFEKEIEKKETKFPQVADVCKTLKKYEYANDTYAIVAPTGIRDIMQEGRLLNHCVSNRDRYLDRIVKRESYILFLRRTSALRDAYYTLEIEPDGTIRQKRTLNDEQREDIKDAASFLSDWQKEIANRLSEEDRALSHQSRGQRKIEFETLKKEGTVIHFGSMQGQKLLDVLLADLTENKFVAAA